MGYELHGLDRMKTSFFGYINNPKTFNIRLWTTTFLAMKLNR
ncbi:hypothetical protein [Bacillus sp. SIMBA_074]